MRCRGRVPREQQHALSAARRAAAGRGERFRCASSAGDGQGEGAEEEDDEAEVSASDLIEMEVSGFSVSDEGFVALLLPKGRGLSIPSAGLNPVEKLRGVTEPEPKPTDKELVLPLLMTETDVDYAASAQVGAHSRFDTTRGNTHSSIIIHDYRPSGANASSRHPQRQKRQAQTILQLVQSPPIDMGTLLPYSTLDDITGMEGSLRGAVLIGGAPSSRWRMDD